MFTKRLASGFAALCVVLTLGMIAPASAQEQNQGQRHGDWVLHCEGQEGCFLVQSLVAEETGNTIMLIGIEHEAEGSFMVVTLPLGILLGPGIAFKIDEREPIQVPFHHCLDIGCRVVIEMNQSLVQAMRAGSNGIVAFFAQDGEQVNFPVSLSGFTAGYTALTQR